MTHSIRISEAFVSNSLGSTVEPGIGLTASSIATLRPFFVSFFSRSRLLGSSNEEASATWGGPSASKRGYFRSAGGNDVNDSPEELNLSGLPKGDGVSTVIQSTNEIRSSEERAERQREGQEKGAAVAKETGSDDTSKRIHRFNSVRRLESISAKTLTKQGVTWSSDETPLREESLNGDASSRLSAEAKRRIEVRKTTEVTTTSEWRGPRSPTPSGIGMALSAHPFRQIHEESR